MPLPDAAEDAASDSRESPTVAPAPIPNPEPQPAPNPYDDITDQRVGAQKALLASSMTAAAETKADRQSKVVALADKLGMSSDVVDKNYDYLNRSVQLRDVDYNRLLAHHPEVSSWLTVPENASIAHDDVPVLQTIDRAFRSLAGIPHDANGILPDGYMFKPDGTIRGPLHLDGTEPVIYKNLDAVRAKFEREDAQHRVDEFAVDEAARRLSENHWLPNLMGAAESSVAATGAAIARATGGRWTVGGMTGEELATGSQMLQQGSQRLDPSLSGGAARLAGSLIGDAPLYLLGGEVAGIADVAASLKTVAAGAKTLATPRSEYLIDAFKTAVAYSPVAARSGINTGSENGAGYGITDFLINAAGPAAFGSRFGLANAIVPGKETAAAAAGWLGVSGRLLTHIGSQGGINAATELANAIHEHAAGVNPDALTSDQLVPRLAEAGAMGALLAGAFQIPGQVGEQVRRQQIASHAAMDHADQLGSMVELFQASKTEDRSPERMAALLKGLVPEEARTTHYQTEDWEGVAKDAGMTPEDLASAMHVEEQYRLAKATGQSMSVPTGDLVQALSKMEKPEGVTSALLHARKTPEGINADEALTFYKEKPAEIDAQIAAMKADLSTAAKSMSEADPIYQDMLGKAVDAGRPVDEAKQDARLMAAFFNTKAERWNDGAAERGATPIDPLEEYQRYQLRIQTERPGTGIEPLDAMLDRIRKGDIPKTEMGPLAKITAKKGITPETVEQARTDGLISEPTPEALSAAIEEERASQAPNPIREGLRALHGHLKSKGIDIAKSNAEIKALLTGDELPAVKQYDQPGSGSRKGSIGYNAERHFLVTLTGKADLSTVLHEAGHFFLEVMGDYAERGGAPEQFRSDFSDIMKFLGVEKRADIGDTQHEKWARSVEQYLMDGHAPSPELRPVFQRFALWLAHLYRKVKALVTLTPEVKRVMDRMLATDEAIKRTQEDLGTSTIFKDRSSSGMTEKEWTAYLRDIQAERERSYANVFNKAMATLRRENTKTYRREHADAMTDAADIVNKRPVHIAEDYLVHGLDAEGKDLAEKPKLDRAEIERDYGKGTIHKLPRGITADDGMSLQMAADLFGFKTGDELWTALVNIPDRKAEIRKLADGIMQARHPDLSPEIMLTKAMEAVHANSSHADVLGRESAALAIKANRRAIPQEQIKSIAEGVIAETNHRDVNPNLHLRTQRKASKEATDAMFQDPPDYTAAFLAKQREELSHALYRAAMEAKAVIEKADELMRDAKRMKTRQMLGKAGGQTWMVTNANGMVTPFMDEHAATTFAKSSQGVVSRGPGFLVAMDQMRAMWHDKSIRFDMNYGAVSDFYDAARSIMHQAKEAFTITVEGKREAIEKEVTTALRTENEVRKAPLVQPRTLGPLDKAGRWLAQLDAFQRKLSFVARQMDGDKNGGWHWERLVRPLNKASDNEQSRRSANIAKMNELYAAWGKTGTGKKTFIPAIQDRLSLEGRIMVALNSGSSKNLERLMTGEGWTREQVKAVTDTLDQKDWAFVKGVWGHINSFWPEIVSVKQRLDGIPPEKRDAIAVDTPFGTIDGHYFPIVYDPHLSAKSLDISIDQKRQSLFGKPTSGFTEKTAESTGLRILLDARAITNHMDSVAHYLSHAETIADLNKLLSNKVLSQNIIDRFGMEAYKIIRDTVQDVASGNQGPQGAVEKAVKFLRTRSGAAVMGFNVMSGATQIFGMTQSMQRVGVGAYVRAQGRVLESAMAAESATKFVMARSEFMANRANNQILETMETQGSGALGQGANWARQHAYWLMHRVQWLVDVPTWLAAHDNALKEFPGDDAKAVDLADQAVIDTQGTGLTKDLSKVQRYNEFTKTLMQFGSFFNSTYNLGRGAITATDFKDPSSVAKLAGSFLLLVSLPTVALGAFKEAVKPSKDDDGTPEYWAKRLSKDHLSYLLGTMVLGREFSGAINGFDYSGPAGLRAFSVISSLIKQTGQLEADHGLEKAALMTGGTLFGLPAVQVQRVIDGILYDSAHGSKSPVPLLFGPPGK